jgi:hypothetical protein
VAQANMVPAANQIDQLKAQLLDAFVQKAAAEAAIKAADEKIVAIRNVLAGVGLGVELQKAIVSAPVE